VISIIVFVKNVGIVGENLVNLEVELVQNSNKNIVTLMGGWPVPPELHEGIFFTA